MVGERVDDLLPRREVLDLGLVDAEDTRDGLGELEDGVRRVGADVERLVRGGGTSIERAITGATSSMCVNARVWRPSPKIVIGRPLRSWFMKIPMTLRYVSAMFCSSP